MSSFEKTAGSKMLEQEEDKRSRPPSPFITRKRMMLWFNCFLLGCGMAGGPLVMRLYYIHGGNGIWFQAFLETAGFPIMILPMGVSYYRRRKSSINDSSPCKVFFITPPLLAAGAGIGLVAGAADYFYSRGVNLIPVSTSSLVLSTQLGFTAIFCYFLVKQQFTPHSINAIFLLTVAAVVLALHSNSGSGASSEESSPYYYMGFFMTLASSALYAIMFPLVEVAYRLAKGVVNYSLVLEMQCILSISATILCAIGMAISKEYQEIPKEAKAFELGEARYYIVLVWSAIMWQFFYLGALGVVHFGSALLSGIIVAVCLSVTEILAVIFYGESFPPPKWICLGLSIWGFISYFYGEIEQLNIADKDTATTTANAKLDTSYQV